MVKLLINSNFTVTLTYAWTAYQFFMQIIAYDFMVDSQDLYLCGQIVKLNADLSSGFKSAVYKLNSVTGSFGWAYSYGDFKGTTS